jgi:hypothetical protein
MEKEHALALFFYLLFPLTTTPLRKAAQEACYLSVLILRYFTSVGMTKHEGLLVPGTLLITTA